MTGMAMYADLMARMWDLHVRGESDAVRDAYSKFLLMRNVNQQIPGADLYVMHKRGIFKTTTARTGGAAAWKPKPLSLTPDAIAEIEYRFAALKPYLSTASPLTNQLKTTRTQSTQERAKKLGESKTLRPSGFAFKGSWTVFTILSTIRRPVHHLPAEQRQLALEILERVGRDRVHVAVPDRDVGVLARLDRSDAVLEKHLMRGPDRERAQRGLDVHRFGGAERRGAVGAVQRLARDRRPEAVSRRERRHVVVGPARPLDALRHVGAKRIQAEAALRPEVAGVVVADPPGEGRLRFRIPGV